MKNLFFITLIILSFWSCDSRKVIAYKKFDDPKTKFKIQEGLRLPIISEDKLSFTENEDFKHKKNKNVYFEYQIQIGYHEKGKIEYFVNWLSGNKLNYDFEIGTKYFFDEEGRLIDSLNLDDYFQTDIKKIYKKLYEFEEPYNFENINYIDRTFDNNNSFWIISYNNQRKDIIIDDKTLKIYFIKDFDNEILSIYKKIK